MTVLGKVTGLRTACADLPFDPPVGTGYARLASAGCVLVFLESDGGAVGEGLAMTLNGQHIRVLQTLIEEMAPLVTGLDCGLSGQFFPRAAASLRSFGMAGFAAAAASAIECALYDLRAKMLGLSVARMLGAAHAALPVYHSGDLWVSLSIDELQRNAERHLARGFRAMKVRLTGREAQDTARLKAVRDVIGPDAALLADLNQKLTAPEAIRLGHALEPFNLYWLEEPVAAEDHAAEASVAAALDVPIATGESVYGSAGVMDLLRAGAADIVMPDLQRMGGPGEFLRAAAIAHGFNVPCSSHLFTEMSLHLLASLPNPAYLEYMPWVSPVYQESLELDAKGHALVPDRPGWGFSFDPKRFT